MVVIVASATEGLAAGDRSCAAAPDWAYEVNVNAATAAPRTRILIFILVSFIVGQRFIAVPMSVLPRRKENPAKKLSRPGSGFAGRDKKNEAACSWLAV